MRQITFLFILLIFSVALSPLPQAGPGILYGQDFNSGVASEWQLEQGWTISPSEGGFALEGGGHVWATMTSGAWSDYFLRFRVKLEGAASLHANVMVVGSTRYFIGLTSQGLYLSKQTDPNTFFDSLANSPALAAGWHTVEIGAAAGKVNVNVDQQPVMHYTDPQPLVNGGIAFESLGDGTVWVDDVIVGRLVPPGAALPPAGSPTLTVPSKVEQATQPVAPGGNTTQPVLTPTADGGKRFPAICCAQAPLVMIVFGCLGWGWQRKNRAKKS